MADLGVLIQNSVQAMNIDAFNRSVISADDIGNGSVFGLANYSATAGEGEVWTAVKPATGSLTNLWMAFEPEVVLTVSGTKQYKGINPDVRDFTNVAGQVFTGFKLQLGDILTLTDGAITGSKASNGFITATDGDYKLNWAASAGAGVTLTLKDTTYISIADGSISNQRTTAYRFEVTKLA